MNILLLIFLLFLVLAILVILNHIEIVSTDSNTTTNTSTNTSTNTNTGQMVSVYDNIQGTCADTHFGCCPDGINSKDNIFGSNCPSYKETQ